MKLAESNLWMCIYKILSIRSIRQGSKANWLQETKNGYISICIILYINVTDINQYFGEVSWDWFLTHILSSNRLHILKLMVIVESHSKHTLSTTSYFSKIHITLLSRFNKHFCNSVTSQHQMFSVHGFSLKGRLMGIPTSVARSSIYFLVSTVLNTLKTMTKFITGLNPLCGLMLYVKIHISCSVNEL